MSTKKKFVSVWESIALTNKTLGDSVYSLNQTLASNSRTIQHLIDSLEQLSKLTFKLAEKVYPKQTAPEIAQDELSITEFLESMENPHGENHDGPTDS